MTIDSLSFMILRLNLNNKNKMRTFYLAELSYFCVSEFLAFDEKELLVENLHNTTIDVSTKGQKLPKRDRATCPSPNLWRSSPSRYSPSFWFHPRGRRRGNICLQRDTSRTFHASTSSTSANEVIAVWTHPNIFLLSLPFPKLVLFRFCSLHATNTSPSCRFLFFFFQVCLSLS